MSELQQIFFLSGIFLKRYEIVQLIKIFLFYLVIIKCIQYLNYRIIDLNQRIIEKFKL